MSLEWGVYRQKPYGWQVRRQRKAAWAAEEAACPGRAARCDILTAGKWRRRAPAPVRDLACLLK